MSTSEAYAHVPPADVHTNDVLRMHGVDVHVMETGYADCDTTGQHADCPPAGRWWATVLGVTEEDREATSSTPWTAALCLKFLETSPQYMPLKRL
ncbi:hypothetical protein ACFY05_32890 [Microtetraspora fusca]|uniref:Uncharacterized protein n=1 Tax=Microtetraspora fusca TaxID=1997 RepID=A0ABW6VE51_MICFU